MEPDTALIYSIRITLNNERVWTQLSKSNLSLTIGSSCIAPPHGSQPFYRDSSQET